MPCQHDKLTCVTDDGDTFYKCLSCNVLLIPDFCTHDSGVTRIEGVGYVCDQCNAPLQLIDTSDDVSPAIVAGMTRDERQIAEATDMSANGMPLSQKQIDAAHEQYVKLTQDFLRPFVARGLSWAGAHGLITFGDDEKDECVVNPLYPDIAAREDCDHDGLTHVHDNVYRCDECGMQFVVGPDTMAPMTPANPVPCEHVTHSYPDDDGEYVCLKCGQVVASVDANAVPQRRDEIDTDPDGMA